MSLFIDEEVKRGMGIAERMVAKAAAASGVDVEQPEWGQLSAEEFFNTRHSLAFWISGQRHVMTLDAEELADAPGSEAGHRHLREWAADYFRVIQF